MKPTISETDVLKDLVRLAGRKANDAGLTTAEWADRAGMSPVRIVKLLRAGIKAGKVTRGIRMQENFVGRVCPFHVYAIKCK